MAAFENSYATPEQNPAHDGVAQPAQQQGKYEARSAVSLVEIGRHEPRYQPTWTVNNPVERIKLERGNHDAETQYGAGDGEKEFGRPLHRSRLFSHQTSGNMGSIATPRNSEVLSTVGGGEVTRSVMRLLDTRASPGGQVYSKLQVPPPSGLH